MISPGRGVWNEKLNHLGRRGDAVHDSTRRSAEQHSITTKSTRLICDGAADQRFGRAHHRAGRPSAHVEGHASGRSRPTCCSFGSDSGPSAGGRTTASPHARGSASRRPRGFTGLRWRLCLGEGPEPRHQRDWRFHRQGRRQFGATNSVARDA